MTAPHEPPRRLLLGADAWQVLVEQLGGLALPPPLRPVDGPQLDDEQRSSAVAALRDAGVLTPGATDDVVAALHPSVRAGMTVHLAPQVVVDSVVRRGAQRTTARHAAAGPLASGLMRTTVEAAAGRETGPVELTTMLLDDLAADVVRVLGELPAVGDRRPVRLDAAASLAAVRALQEGRGDVAGVLPDLDGADAGEGAGPALQALADGVRAVARVALVGGGRRLDLAAVETGQGWWQVQTAGDDVVLRPLDTDALVTRLAGALAAVLAGGAA